MNRVYRGWIFNPKAGGGWKATNGRGQTIQAKDITWIMREIDRIEYDRMRGDDNE